MAGRNPNLSSGQDKSLCRGSHKSRRSDQRLYSWQFFFAIPEASKARFSVKATSLCTKFRLNIRAYVLHNAGVHTGVEGLQFQIKDIASKSLCQTHRGHHHTASHTAHSVHAGRHHLRGPVAFHLTQIVRSWKRSATGPSVSCYLLKLACASVSDKSQLDVGVQAGLVLSR